MSRNNMNAAKGAATYTNFDKAAALTRKWVLAKHTWCRWMTADGPRTLFKSSRPGERRLYRHTILRPVAPASHSCYGAYVFAQLGRGPNTGGRLIAKNSLLTYYIATLFGFSGLGDPKLPAADCRTKREQRQL